MPITIRNRSGEVLKEIEAASLFWADLSGANLSGANLSGASGLLDPHSWLEENFAGVPDGYVVYKRIRSEGDSGLTEHPAPEGWVVSPGSYLTEVVDPCPVDDCGCGVNFGTLRWCRSRYVTTSLYECLLDITCLPSLVVPYHTDGKARSGRLKILRKLDPSEYEGLPADAKVVPS